MPHTPVIVPDERPTIPAAYGEVTAGGVILLKAGWHVVDNLVIGKEVTIEAYPGDELQAGARGGGAQLANMFRMNAAGAGFTLRNLLLRNENALKYVVDAAGDNFCAEDCEVIAASLGIAFYNALVLSAPALKRVSFFGGTQAFNFGGAGNGVYENLLARGLTGPWAYKTGPHDTLTRVIASKQVGGGIGFKVDWPATLRLCAAYKNANDGFDLTNPAIDIAYCEGYGNGGSNYALSGGAGLGPECTENDPTFVAEDAGTTAGYKILVASLSRNRSPAGIADYWGQGLVGAKFDVGIHEFKPSVLSASSPHRRAVVVTFDAAPSGGSLAVAAAWAVATTDGVSDEPPVASVAINGTEVTLTMLGPMSPGGAYTVTAPDDVPLVGYSATFIVTEWRTEFTAEGILEALTGAFGSQLAGVEGQPVTRLAAPLAPGQTHAEVESTLHFVDAEGVARIGPEKVLYSSRTSNLLLGLTRGSNIIDTYPIGTEVRDESWAWGHSRRAWAETVLSVCPADFTDQLAIDRGSPRPLPEMTPVQTRAYARVRHYLDAATWWACFRVLREAFRWSSRSGVNATTYAPVVQGRRRLDIPAASLPIAEQLHDRWLYVGGRLLRVRSARDDIQPPATSVLVEANAGPYWESSDHFENDSGLAWELLAFRMVECHVSSTASQNRMGLLKVYVHAAADVLPATYLVTAGLATPQGRLMRGKLKPDNPAGPPPAGHGAHQSFYLAQPYRTAVLAMLEDVVPCGVEIEVVSRRAAP